MACYPTLNPIKNARNFSAIETKSKIIFAHMSSLSHLSRLLTAISSHRHNHHHHHKYLKYFWHKRRSRSKNLRPNKTLKTHQNYNKQAKKKRIKHFFSLIQTLIFPFAEEWWRAATIQQKKKKDIKNIINYTSWSNLKMKRKGRKKNI